MGVTQLWQILEPVKRVRSLRELRGTTLAVDLSAWIVDSNSVKKMSGTVVKPHLRNLFFRVLHLLQLEITPVFVLEGRAPELKLEVMNQRNRARYGSNGGKSRRCNRSQLARVVRECCEMLDYLGLPYVRSAGEAEAMCAFLNEEKMVEACITQDGDAFLYGARTVIRNFTTTGKEPVVEVYCMSDVEATLNLDRERLVGLALLLGCDYNPKGVPGVGKEQAMKLIQGMPKHQSLLERFSQWQSPKFVADLSCELDSRPLPHCKNCGHPGSSRDHTATGCVMCQSSQYCYPSGYDYRCVCEWHRKKSASENSSAELAVCRKARQLTHFPDAKIIDEFLRRQNRKPTTTFYWSRPSLEKLWSFNLEVLTWPETYTTEKVVPLLTLWDMRDIDGGRYGGHLVPVRILKTRIRLGIPCYEVEWEKLVDDVYTVNEYYTTVEEQTTFGRCFPDLVSRYEEENGKKPCRKKSKKKTTADLVDDDLSEAMRQSLHLGSGNNEVRTTVTESAGSFLPVFNDRVEMGVSQSERFSKSIGEEDCGNGNNFSKHIVGLNDHRVDERDCYHSSKSVDGPGIMTSSTQRNDVGSVPSAPGYAMNSSDRSDVDSDEDVFNIPLSQRLARKSRLIKKVTPPPNAMADIRGGDFPRTTLPSSTDYSSSKSDVIGTHATSDRTIEEIVNFDQGNRSRNVSGGTAFHESPVDDAAEFLERCFEFEDNLEREVECNEDNGVSQSEPNCEEGLVIKSDCEIKAKSGTLAELHDSEMKGLVNHVKKEKMDLGLEQEIPLIGQQSEANLIKTLIKTEKTEYALSKWVTPNPVSTDKINPVKIERKLLSDECTESTSIASKESVKVEVEREFSTNVSSAETNFKSELLPYDEEFHKREVRSVLLHESETRNVKTDSIYKQEENELNVLEKNLGPVVKSTESRVKTETEIADLPFVFSDEGSDCSDSTGASDREDSFSDRENETETFELGRVPDTAGSNGPEWEIEDRSGMEGGGFIPGASVFRWDDNSEFESLPISPSVGFHGNSTLPDFVRRIVKSEEMSTSTSGLSIDDVIDLCDTSDSDDVDDVTLSDVIEPHSVDTPCRTGHDADMQVLSSGGGDFIVRDVRKTVDRDVIIDASQSASANNTSSETVLNHETNVTYDTILSQTFFERLEISESRKSLDSIPNDDRILTDRTNLLSESILSKDISELISEVETIAKKPKKKKRTRKKQQIIEEKLVDTDVKVGENEQNSELFSDSFIKNLAGRTMLVPDGSSMTFLDPSEAFSPLTPFVARSRARRQKSNKAKRVISQASGNGVIVEFATDVVFTVTETASVSDGNKTGKDVQAHSDGSRKDDVGNSNGIGMASEVEASNDIAIAAEVQASNGIEMAAEEYKMAGEVPDAIIRTEHRTDEAIYGNFSLMTSLLNFDVTLMNESSNHL